MTNREFMDRRKIIEKCIKNLKQKKRIIITISNNQIIEMKKISKKAKIVNTNDNTLILFFKDQYKYLYEEEISIKKLLDVYNETALQEKLQNNLAVPFLVSISVSLIIPLLLESQSALLNVILYILQIVIMFCFFRFYVKTPSSILQEYERKLVKEKLARDYDIILK